MSNLTIQKLHEWLELRTVSFDRFVAEKKIHESDIHADAEMYQLKHLTIINNLDVFPGHLYFQASGELAFIYIYEKMANQLSLADITDFYGKEEIIERSRAGKTSHYKIYAKQGFAFSCLGKEIHFLDVFPSMTTEDYLRTIYQRPGPFIR